MQEPLFFRQMFFKVLILVTLGFSITTIFTTSAQANACDHMIGTSIKKADGKGNYAKVSPGDTVCIKGGQRDVLMLQNFRGKPNSPITFINVDGQVIIETNSWVGLSVENSHYFRLTGTGSNARYGIRISGATNSGLKLMAKTEEFEVDHIEISQIDGVGVSAQTKETCPDGSTNYYDFDDDGKIDGDRDDTVSRDTFTQNNSTLHDIYVHHVSTEGFYVGSSFFNGKEYKCDNGRKTVYPPVLKGVRIYNNRVEHAGWNGIQVGSARQDCFIHHNEVRYDSEAYDEVQNSGMTINWGSTCDIYNNFIKDGQGPGIFTQGDGEIRIYNNVIINAGQGSKAGDKRGTGISGYIANYSIWHNTIVNPKNIGIKLSSDAQVQNNLIIAPGNGKDAYIVSSEKENSTISNNLQLEKLWEARFVNPSADNYALNADSPAVDAGKNISVNQLKNDYAGTSRPNGKGVDIGAYEFVQGNSTPPSFNFHIYFPFVANK